MKTLTAFWKSLKCNWLAAIVVVVLLVFPATQSQAQQDSVSVAAADTLKYKRLDPRKALFYSAIFPGLGQMYNNKYWKLPFVYGGFAVTFTVVSYYQKNYVRYRDELFIQLATGNSPSGLSETTLRYAVDKTRRQRDYYTIISGFWYLLQIVDAHVDAHLQDFKFNKNMDITLKPSMEQNNIIGRTAGFTLTFKF